MVLLFCLLTFVSGYILNLHLPHLCHVAQHRKDDEARHKAGQTVYQAGHDGVAAEEEAAQSFNLLIEKHFFKQQACLQTEEEMTFSAFHQVFFTNFFKLCHISETLQCF